MCLFICIFSALLLFCYSFFFFFNDTATTEIYTLSLHDALPISGTGTRNAGFVTLLADDSSADPLPNLPFDYRLGERRRSEEHTSELQSLAYLVCRLLLEKKKKKKNITL